jgi:pimeloyl-ACP methyl ester carboxylesterase
MRTLVLIPGLLCNRELWTHQIARLLDFAEILVPVITSQITISQMAREILDEAPQHFSLAGFSLGSQVALQIMQLASERVDRLALLSATSGGLLPPVRAAIRKAIEMLESGCFAEYLEATYSSYFAPAHVEDAKLKRRFIDMAYAVGPDAGLRQMKALLELDAPFTNLGWICCPTLVLGGSEDHRTTPAAHEALARAIPGASLVMVEDAGHFTPLEQPLEVTEAIQHWLDE